MCQPLLADADYAIVFIHIGKQLPAHAEIALSQARLFNPDCPIMLVASEEAVINFTPQDPAADTTIVTCESLVKTADHERFIKNSTLDKNTRAGFWLYTSERFFYLNDLMVQYGLKNVFHLEYDNMLYVDLAEQLPIFRSQYQGIAATFDNDNRCIAGFIYIPDAEVMTCLAKFFADRASHGSVSENDMVMLAAFRKKYGEELIDNLPIIPTEYVDDHGVLVSPFGDVASDAHKYCQNIDLFQSIFDAAALGQYLGGIDPRNGPSEPGFINESCVFNPSQLTYEWHFDAQDRGVPYAVYAERKYRISNLHIHSKRLELFSSREDCLLMELAND